MKSIKITFGIVALILSTNLIAQTKADYDELKAKFYTIAAIDMPYCNQIAETLSSYFNLGSDNGLMCVFNHKVNPNLSFMYKVLDQFSISYIWQEEEKYLSDFRLKYDTKIQNLGYKKIKDLPNELVYRFCDKNLTLTVKPDTYTGLISCQLIMSPNQMLIKYGCQ